MHLDRSNNSDQKQKIIINNQTRVVKYPNHINKPTHRYIKKKKKKTERVFETTYRESVWLLGMK